MNQFTGLTLKNTGPFKDQTFDFTPGLHVIYGWNKSNKKSNTNANGAGKSFFFHQIQEILMESPIIGEKSDRVKKGDRTLHFKIKDKSVDITRKNTKLSITVDGKPKKFRTQTIAKEWVKRRVPLTTEDIATYVHIDARIPHPLVMGSTIDRRKFFTKFFSMDKLDMERKLYLAKLNELSKVKAAYQEVKSEYRLAKEDLIPKEELLKLRADYGVLRVELKELTRKNDKIQDIKTVLSFYEAASSQIKQLLRILDSDVVTEEAFAEKKKETEWHLEKDLKELKEAEAYEEYKREIKAYTDAYSKLGSRARKMFNEWGLTKALAKAGKHVDRVDDINAALSILKDVIRNNKPSKPEKVEKVEGDRGEIINRLDSLRHQLEHAEKFNKGTCETCGQSVKVKDPKEIRLKIKKLKRQLEAIDDYKEYRKERAEYERCVNVVEKAKEEIKKLEEEQEPLNKYLSVYRDLRVMPDKPRKFEGKKLEVSVKQRMVDEDKERMHLFKFIEPNLEFVVRYFALTEKQKNRAQNSGKLQKKIEEANESLSAIRAKLEIHKSVRQRADRLKARMEEMKEQLKDEPAWRLLADAYSDKGVKKLAIQSISHRLMEIVNRYAKMVFPEDYTFSIEWLTRDLNILVHRRYGKKVIPSDVRKLSGAESKIFTFILILALLTFVPHSKRSSLMVLDEPTANFSQDTTDAFRRFLPVLLSVIPTVVLITPKTDERYENSKDYTVIKTNGRSSIVKGRPSELITKKRKA